VIKPTKWRSNNILINPIDRYPYESDCYPSDRQPNNIVECFADDAKKPRDCSI
jgi:hypothetical protein